MEEKLELLKSIIGKYGSAVIAFSGGVDSALLARAAADTPGMRALLVTASSSTYPAAELEAARSLAALMGLPHRVIESEETEIPGFSENPPDRCYYCKRELFSRLKAIADREGYAAVFDGSNADDLADYRPGRRALAEFGVVSPLCEAGLTKNEIRELSRRYGLPTAGKPSYACMASRFPYGEAITRAKLARAERAERALRDLGLKQFRVRSHGDLARVEAAPGELDNAWRLREKISAACKQAGFVFASLDFDGYRTGAMNEALGKKT